MNNKLPSLGVIVPCFNEESTVNQILERLVNLDFVSEIIVVDDASTDSTRQILESFKHEKLKVLFQQVNRGKGAALRRGISEISTDYLVIQDADLEYYPEDLEELFNTAISRKADAVFGSRFLTSGSRRAVFYWHRLGNAFLTHLSNARTNIYLTDMETCYKMMRTNIAKTMDLQENRFGIEPEFTAKLAAVSSEIYEVPIRYDARNYAEGKKIGWKDGVSALRAILKYSTRKQKKKMRSKFYS
jgi:glycosyltransferase involved in cell wall biosynthesis